MWTDAVKHFKSCIGSSKTTAEECWHVELFCCMTIIVLIWLERPFLEFKWVVFDNPLYSPVLASSDYQLFIKLQDFLSGEHFQSDDSLKEDIEHWLASLAEVYKKGISKLILRNDKRLNPCGGYIKKWVNALLLYK